jgi:hypothetical protein
MSKSEYGSLVDRLGAPPNYLCLISTVAALLLCGTAVRADDADPVIDSAAANRGAYSFRQPHRQFDDANNDAVIRQLQKLLGNETHASLVAPGADSTFMSKAARSCKLDDKYDCPESRDNKALGLQIGFVGTHDAALLVGLLPFPAISIAAELTSYSSNLALKAVPPYLRQPLNRSVDPFPARDAGAFATDGCGIEFELLSAQAEYENLFGIVPLTGPYTSLVPFRVVPWYPKPLLGVGEDETRWGFLRAPLLYHANTEVSLQLESPSKVQKWNAQSQQFEEGRFPIDASAEDPQNVYLPIGDHTVRWRSATLMSPLFDVLVDGVAAAISIRSEMQTIKGGVVAARRAAVVLSDDVASAALDPKSQKRFNRALAKFREYMRAAFKKNKKDPIAKKIQEEATDVAGEILLGSFDALRRCGIKRLKKKDAEEILACVEFSLEVINKILEVYDEHYPRNPNRHDIDFIEDHLGENIGNIILSILEGGDKLIFAFFSTETTKSVKNQTVTVWDSIPPTISLTGDTLVLEATDFGGTRLSRSRAKLMKLAQDGSSDNCGREPIITMDAPEFLPLGLQTVEFTFTDRGPNPANDNNDYAPTFTQTIDVQDNQAPLLLAPPSKVILATDDVPLDREVIGTAIAVDLVDAEPEISDNAPDPLPRNTRTEIIWTAIDDSGNKEEKSQLISIKSTNNPPVINNTPIAETITAVAVDIELRAEDPDVLGGIRDPLWFEIVDRPRKGEFVAPLFPFFVNDFRTRPNDAIEGYNPELDVDSNYVPNLIRLTYCSTDNPPPGGRIPPVDFVHNAEFVQVDDEGIWHVWDDYFECLAFDDSGLNQKQRISRWDAEGNFLGHLIIQPGTDPTEKAFQLDRNGKLYYSSTTNGGSSTLLRLHGCLILDEARFPDGSYSCAESEFYTFEGDSKNEVVVDRLEYARIDSTRNLAYLYQEGGGLDSRIWLYELRASGSSRYVGEIGPRSSDGSDTVTSDWIGTVPTIAVGSDGSVYVNDEARHRIHKISPPSRTEDGSLVAGIYIGWAGRCDTTTNNACDTDLGRSRGFSCTDDTCAFAGDGSGSSQGQFNTPRYIAIDPNDVLYVADYNNGRVQRLAPDGSFAGEAKSTGTGVNTGDEPSFILGNMGNPASIAVNSSQFFVIDREEKFVHIFGSLPFKEIKNDSVTVSYLSHQDFPNPRTVDVDSFTFHVTDGLAYSVPETATVTVSRNFRPPEDLGVETAEDYGCPAVVWRSNESACLNVALDEDTTMDFSFTSYDPDGIIGEDFLGLDTVSYAIVRPPRHGRIERSASGWTYRPRPNFYGDDRVVFKANDGHDDSEPATLKISVRPINDPPIVNIELPDRTALGFPTLATAVFTDDLSEEYWADTWWGDGSSDGTGSFILENDEARIDGVAIIPPPQEGFDGRAVASHVFNQEGQSEIRMCVLDSGLLQTCKSAIINVEPLVSIAIEGSITGEPVPGNGETANDPDVITMEHEDEFADGTDFAVDITISNGEREGGGGLVAEEMQLDLILPANALTGQVSIEQGDCLVDGLFLTCAIGAVDPGGEVKFSMTATGPGNLVYDEYVEFEATLSTTSEVISNDLPLTMTALLVADTADSDGDGMSDQFEQVYFGGATQGDASGDSDQDGLDNRGEYEAGTSPENADSDGDGVNDNDEVMAGMNPLTDDNPPELLIPGDIAVNADGLLTQVDLGMATAQDFTDGDLVPVPSNTGPFAPGRNVVTWSASDEAGNKVEDFQYVDVVPLLNFAIDQTVAEGATAKARVELNGSAVEYPVVVPFTITGTALNPGDHDAFDGEVRIESGLSADVAIDIAKDTFAEPDETIILTLGALTNAVTGSKTVHTITVSELNRAPVARISLEQQGRTTSAVSSDGGLMGVLSRVLDDPANDHTFDWSGSDSGLFDPVSAADPAYLLDPAGLSAGLYNLRLAVTDDGIPPLSSQTGSLVKVVAESPELSVDQDTDGDGVSDADEGTGDEDGDRIPNFLDTGLLSNVLPINTDGRQLETSTGLLLRLGSGSFLADDGTVGLAEQSVGIDLDNAYPNEVLDFEVSNLPPGDSAQVVVPLLFPIPEGAVLRIHINGHWRDFDESGSDIVAAAAGASGACPAPGDSQYAAGLAVGLGCLQLTIQDGGPNDQDEVADGVVRQAGGLAVQVSADSYNLGLAKQRLRAPGAISVARFRLQSDSGDGLLRSLTVEASGRGDDTSISNVLLVIDTNGDGELTGSDVVLASGTYMNDDGTLTFMLDEPYEVPPGFTDLLVVYELFDEEDE